MRREIQKTWLLYFRRLLCCGVGQSWLVLAIGCLVVATGCQNGPVMGRMRQSQLEHERLLAEYRSQKKENEMLRADRDRLLERQAEAEKLAARLQSQLNASQSPFDSNDFDRFSPLADRTDSPPSMTASQGRSSNASSGGLSDRGPSSFGSSSSSTRPPRDANENSPQWRPIRRQ